MRWKKFLAVMLATAMTCNMTGVSAAAQPVVIGGALLDGLHKILGGDDADKDEDAQTDTQKKTRSQMYGTEAASKADSVTLDIGRGDILISGKEISGYDTEGNLVTKSSPRYVVTGSTQEHSIKIADGANANIVLSNVNITRTGDGQSPFEITDDSDGDVSITLEGINNLQAGKGAAAIQKSGTSDKGLSKSGQLKITCGNTSPGHVCDASCGTLVATGGEGAAAIGGAAGRGSSKIDIAGGTITAAGGIGGGSGGVGTKMEFTGGVIDAGTINGKTDGKDNVMNGNVLLFADNTADMKLKKGTVYQRGTGTGTVYGDTEWSQAMVDHLVATGGTMDIPASEKAAVTVDGATDISALAFTEGSQVKVDTSKTPAATEQAAAETTAPTPEEIAPTPEETTQTPEATEEPTATPEPTEEATATPEPTEEVTATPEPTKAPAKARAAKRAVPTEEPVVEEEGQEEVRASEGEDTPTSTPEPLLGIRSTTTEIDITRNGVEIPVGTGIRYGEQLSVNAKVVFQGNQSANFVPSNDPYSLRCYLQKRGTPSENRIRLKSVAVDVQEGPGVTYETSVAVVITGTEVNPGDEYYVVVEFTGTPQYPGSEDQSAVYRLAKGDLRSTTASTISVNATAGQSIRDAIGGSDIHTYINSLPTNEANDVVDGRWQWVSGDSVISGNSIYGQKLYPPSVVDQQYVYEAKYILDPEDESTKYNNYDNVCKVTIRFSVHWAPVTVNPIITVSGSQDKSEDHKDPNIKWYNAENGTITINVPEYEIFHTTNPATSHIEWEKEENWLGQDEYVFKDGFHDGKQDYTLYVRKVDNGEIGSVVIKDFYVDQIYPDVSLAQERTTGETAVLKFETPDESNSSKGSGMYRYSLLTQPTNVSEDEYERKDFAGQETTSTTGEFALRGFSPNTGYYLYLLAEDDAGNEIQFIKRTEDKDKWWKPWDGTDPQPADYLHYGYCFKTKEPNLEGEISLIILDPQGNPKTDGSVGSGDKVQVQINEISSTARGLKYTWFRRSSNGNEEEMTDVMDDPVYTVRDRDIGSQIVCHVTATNMSSYLQAATNTVGLGACPEDLKPTNGRENLEERTFTFTGHVGTVYEYRINDDPWKEVDPSNRSDFVIEVGDRTVLSGNLKVRAKATDEYLASDPPLTNDENFISTGELDITLEGDHYYGGTLTASISSQAIDSSLFTYQWSCDDGRTFDNAGSSYQIQKEDINKHVIVKVSVQGYEGADNTATSRLIGKRPVDAVVSVTPRQYDGTTTADAEVGLTGVINGDNVTASASVAFDNKNAGEDKSVRVTNRQEGGTDIAYYNVRWPNNGDVKGTILPATLNLTMQASDKVYDGTTDAVVTFEAEPLAGDSVEVSGTGQFADKNAGTNKRVTPKDVVITGADAANYTGTGSTASTTASITPKSIQIESITVQDKVYDGTTDAVITATFKGAVDDVSYTYTAAFESPNVGKDIPVSAEITLEGDSAKNYTLANGKASGTGNITRAPAPYEESDIPQGLTGIEGKKLSSVFIGRGFNWEDSSTIMKVVGRHSYPAIYNPDPSQYGDRVIQLEVLVQCAEHTWGDWSITAEPTKEEVGERQRICGVCGYIETETIPRAPYIANEDTKVGWDDIIQAINNASSGTEIPVEMNGTETLPAPVLDALQGREVSIVLQMGDGITWTIRGEDITASTLKDINMALTMYTDNIPSDVLDSYAKDKTIIQLHLAYSGDFGFIATLRIPLGDEYAGIDSTLYYYNPTRERLEKMDSNKVTSDGIGRYDFTHASDYAVAIDRQADPNVNGGDTPSGNNNPGGGTVTPIAPSSNGTTTGGSTTAGGSTATTTGGASAGQTAATGTASSNTSSNTVGISSNGAKTEDDTPIALYVILLLAGAGGVGAAWIYRQRRKTKE